MFFVTGIPTIVYFQKHTHFLTFSFFCAQIAQNHSELARSGKYVQGHRNDGSGREVKGEKSVYLF